MSKNRQKKRFLTKSQIQKIAAKTEKLKQINDHLVNKFKDLERKNQHSSNQLNQLQDKIKEDSLLFEAEKQNLIKRQQKDMQNAHNFANQKIIEDFLPVLDSLEMAIAAINPQNSNDQLDSFKQGIENTRNLMLEKLQKHGAQELNPVDGKFDPNQHEAISFQADTNKEHNQVIYVARKGYLLNGRVVRAAQVVINRLEK